MEIWFGNLMGPPKLHSWKKPPCFAQNYAAIKEKDFPEKKGQILMDFGYLWNILPHVQHKLPIPHIEFSERIEIWWGLPNSYLQNHLLFSQNYVISTEEDLPEKRSQIWMHFAYLWNTLLHILCLLLNIVVPTFLLKRKGAPSK